jgi:hypothetical protein
MIPFELANRHAVDRRTMATVLAVLVVAVLATGATAVGASAIQEDVTVTVDANLSDAPGEETTVTFRLVATESGTVVDERTARVGPAGTETGEVTLVGRFENGSLDRGDELRVEANATDGNTEYEGDSLQATARATPGETYDRTGALELAAEPLTVTTDANLSVVPAEETTVRFLLVVRNDEEGWAEVIDNATTTVGPEETNTGNVTLVGDFANEHLESGEGEDYSNDKLAVVVDAIGGNTNYERYIIWGGHYLRPGHEYDETGKARLAAEPATVNVSAALSHEPVEETTVTFELVERDSGAVLDNATATVSTDESATDTVTLTADFEEWMLTTGDTLTVVASGTHYDEGVVEVTDDVRPGDEFNGTAGPVLEAHQEANFEYTNVTVEPGEITANGVATIRVDVENVGDARGYYRLGVAVDGDRIFSDPRRKLAPGERVTDAVDVVLTEPGEHEITLAGTDRSWTVSVAEPSGRLRIADYELNATELVAGEALAVEATVENNGDQSASLDVPLVVDGTVVATEAVEVGPGETGTVTFEWMADEPGAFDVAVGALDRTAVAVDARRSLGDYTGQEGIVDIDELRAAIGDWRTDEIDTTLLREVVDAWSTQDRSVRGPANLRTVTYS